jgi:dihydroorotase-like cyclic amidohydrolase
VRADEFKSKSDNCPFIGWELVGRATHAIVGGAVKWSLR